MNVLAIIPARGGSKGIPGKNIRLICGKPLLAYSIEHARNTPSVTRTVVSTDDTAIAQVADAYGAEVVWRPEAISGDTATSESALEHTLDYLRVTEQYVPNLVVFLQATSPLRKPDDVERAIQTLVREEADSLFSTGPVHGFIWRIVEGEPRSLSYDHAARPRRQDAPEDLIENGSIYVFKPWVLEKLHNRLGGKIAVYRMEALYSFQVDEPGDVQLLEALVPNAAPPEKAAVLDSVRLLVLDFDGVLTDNRVLVSQNGTESVWCSRADGMGIELLKKAGIPVIVVSKEQNPVVAARCRKLGIESIQGCDEKLRALQAYAQRHGYEAEQIAYVGNDINDLDCLGWVGVPIVVNDCAPEVRHVAQLITPQAGGHGAVRQVVDWLLSRGRCAPRVLEQVAARND